MKVPLIANQWVSRVDRRSATAFVLPFLIYLLTLAPTIYNLDSAELTTAAATGGIVRSTGYPLYLIIGRVWSQIPIGDVGYRMNLFSAVCGASTIAVADLILRKLRVGSWATFGALGLLTCSTYFWALSLSAEVYTMHTLLMAILLLALLHWSGNPSPRRLALVGLVSGLSMSHHGATILLVPGCVWYVLTVAPQRVFDRRAILYTGGALLLGISLYLYLPLCYIAEPAFNYAGHYDASGAFIAIDLRTLDGLWWLVSGRAFADSMFAYEGYALGREIAHFGIELWRAFFAVGIGPGLLGMGLLLRRNWRLGGALLLMFLANAGFYITYRVADKVTMFLPAYLIWALWLGIGYQWLFQWVSNIDDTGSLTFSFLCAMVIGVVFIPLIWNWRLVDLSNDWSARERGEAVLQKAEPNSLVFGWWDTVPVIEYLQLVEGKRSDVRAINRFLIAHDDMLKLIQRDIVHYPIYIDSVSPGLAQSFEVEFVGPLYRLRLKEKILSISQSP